MPSYNLSVEVYGNYVNDLPGFEIWAEGSLFGAYEISSAGSLINATIDFGGSLPSSLEFRFNDGSAEGGRTIEIRNVTINNRHVNTNNFLSTSTLTNGGSSTVDVTDGDFLFDDTPPPPATFTTGATMTYTGADDTFRNFEDITDHVFDMLGGRDVAYLGIGNDTVSGGAGNDIIRGNAGTDILYGDIGDDRLFGEEDNDQLYGGDGNDILQGGDGADELFGHADNDRLSGGDGDDIVVGGDGDDRVSGGAGADNLFGDDGNDSLGGGAGNDSLDAGDGDDLAYGGMGDDIIDGGGGVDILVGQDGDDTIHGGDGDDEIYGMNDQDTLYGNEGADEIWGGDGNDIIDGGGGIDTIEGGLGNDTIYGDNLTEVEVMESGTTTVTQLNSAQWHTINLSTTLDNPVVKMYANDVTGDPFSIRVRNITNTSFEFQLDEYEYLDGATAAETISWMAVSSGTHTLTNGSLIQAGFVTAANEATSAVTFNEAFNSTPVVFSQVSSDNDTTAVVSRNLNVTTTGFSTNMHEQELGAGTHGAETIGWIAINNGGDADNGFVADTTANNVTHTPRAITFNGTFGSTPVFIGDMQTTNGADPAVAAGNGSLTTTGTQTFIDEEGSADAEINHANEVVGYVALDSGVYTGLGFTNYADIIRGGDGDDTIYADSVNVAAQATGSSLSDIILADSPDAYWQLDDTGTTAVNQGSLGSVDGTLTNGVLTGQTALYNGGGDSMFFDGTNDHIVIPNSTGINDGARTQRSFELVFNASSTTGRQVLYEEGGGTNAMTIYLDGTSLYFNVRDAGEYGPFSISTTITAGVTYHAAMTFDSDFTNTFTGYLDGAVVGTGVTNTDLDSHTGQIAIGMQNDSNYYHDGADSSGDTFHFNGFISDVALYNSVLNAADIQERADAVSGILSTTAGAIDDQLYGGDGLDTLYGGEGRDSFIFEALSAFNDIDEIHNFGYAEHDAIDISDVLVGYIDGVSDLNDFVQFTTSGNDTLVGIDADGAGGYTDIARIIDLTGLDVDNMLTNEQIIAV